MRLRSLVVLVFLVSVEARAQTPILTFPGSALAPVGDVDGDGIGDVIVGRPSVAPGGIAEIRSGATGAVLRTLSAVSSYDTFGTSVAGVGDVDGDSIPDVAVGAPQLNPSSLAYPVGCPPYLVYAPGYVRVFSGATGGVIHLWVGPNVPSWASGKYGTSIAAVGDVDGDGLGDLAIAQPGGTLNISNCCIASGGYPGRVEIRSGGPGTVIRLHASSWSEIWPTTVSDVGDVDQDGVPDYAIGGDGQAGGYACWGAGIPAYPERLDVRSGATGAALLSATAPNGPLRIAAAGDVDGDGAADVMARLLTGGSVWSVIWSGASASVVYSIVEPGPGLSIACASAGDRNGDGLDEVLLGDSGLNRLRFLSPIPNSVSSWTLGAGGPTKLEALGDLDGDGTTEFGALGNGTWQVLAGAVASTVTVGGGCGPGAIAPTLTSTSPALGGTLAFSYGFGTPGAMGELIVGFAAPVPIPQGGGCLAYVDLAAGYTVIAPVVLDVTGSWSTSIVIPGGPTYAGFARRVQAYAAPVPTGPVSFEVTNALDITVGH